VRGSHIPTRPGRPETLRPGHCFGEAALAASLPRVEAATAKTSCVVLVLLREHLAHGRFRIAPRLHRELVTATVRRLLLPMRPFCLFSMATLRAIACAAASETTARGPDRPRGAHPAAHKERAAPPCGRSALFSLRELGAAERAYAAGEGGDELFILAEGVRRPLATPPFRRGPPAGRPQPLALRSGQPLPLGSGQRPISGRVGLLPRTHSPLRWLRAARAGRARDTDGGVQALPCRTGGAAAHHLHASARRRLRRRRRPLVRRLRAAHGGDAGP
jgi:hypothetical protein